MSRQGGAVVLTNPTAWPYVRRGSETLMVGLARWLCAHGQAAEIVAGGPRRERYEVDGVPVSLVRQPDLGWIDPRLSSDLLLIPGLAAHLRRLPARLVHSFLYVDAAAARLAGRPYLVSYGGIALPGSFSARHYRRRVFRFASIGARAIVCPSRAAAQHLLDAYGLEAEVVPNAVETQRFAVEVPRQPDLVVCAATADDPRKRVEVLVDAFEIVARQRPNAELALAGSASQQTQRALLERVPPEVARRIHFLGDLDIPNLAEWTARASVSCLPSVNEAFGLVLIEALAAGTPVVGAASGAIPEIIDSEVGATFAPNNFEACAVSLIETMEKADDPATAAACRQRARRYDWSVVGPEIMNLYDRVS